MGDVKEIVDSINRLSGKIDDTNNKIKNLGMNLSKKIDEKKSSLEKTIDSVRTEFSEKIKVMGDEVNKKIKTANMEVEEKLLIKLDELERHQKESDVLLFNVPKIQNEKLEDIFADICIKIGIIGATSISSIFRIPSNSSAPIIVIKFNNVNSKSTFFKKFLDSHLTLDKIGFANAADKKILIRDSITKRNATIWKETLAHKKRYNLPGFVSIRNGLVSYKEENKVTLISNVADIRNITVGEANVVVINDN